MAMRHVEVIVDQWPIGPRNSVYSKGERTFVEDEAARILVGMGKVAYVPERAAPSPAEEPQQPVRRGRYGRRDMRASD